VTRVTVSAYGFVIYAKPWESLIMQTAEAKEFIFVGTLEEWVNAEKSKVRRAHGFRTTPAPEFPKIRTTHCIVDGADREGPRVAVDDKGRKVAVEIVVPSCQTVVVLMPIR